MAQQYNQYTNFALQDDKMKPEMTDTMKPLPDPKLSKTLQKIVKNLVDKFAAKNHLIVPGFIHNIITIYQNNLLEHQLAESRGVIQLYTVYYLLHLVSAYWTGIEYATNHLVNNNAGIIDKLIRHPKFSRPKNPVLETESANINSIQETMKKTSEFLKMILFKKNTNQSKIPIAIKYFLFQHPVNVDWRFYDTIIYYTLVLLIAVYNYVYLMKTINRLKAQDQKELQKLFHSDYTTHEKFNKKPIEQLYMLFAYIRQHASLNPYTADISVNNTYKKMGHTQESFVGGGQDETNNFHDQINNEVAGYKPEENDYNNEARTKHTVGSYSILTTIFKLMYYHPFPYNPKMLKKHTKNHPIVSANNRQMRYKKQTLGQDGYQRLLSAGDREMLTISGEIKGTFTQAYSYTSGFIGSLTPETYIDSTGRKRTSSKAARLAVSSFVPDSMKNHADAVLKQQTKRGGARKKYITRKRRGRRI